MDTVPCLTCVHCAPSHLLGAHSLTPHAMSFLSLGLSQALSDAAMAQGYHSPTPVQASAIGPILQGRDVQAHAPTGSGKTAAFVLPLLELLVNTRPPSSTVPRRPLVLVLVPTRELAVQVGESFRQLANRLSAPLRITVVFGGVSINPQMMGLRGGTDVVVATPGRLLDLLDHNALTLSHVQALVLDEADRLLDLGFADELDELLDTLPSERQNLFFSATFPAQVQGLANHLLHEPVHITPPPEQAIPADIAQRALVVGASQRTQLLRHLVSTEHWRQVLVFVATQHASEIVAEKLRKARISAEPFHGQLSQGKRTQVLADFKAGRVRVVVATDVAARGLDIVDLPVVVNFDLPRSPADYAHRIGRTGRAGAKGLAISLVSTETESHLRLIEKRQGISLERELVAGFEPPPPSPRTDETTGQPSSTAAQQVQPDPNGGIKGKRPNKKDKLRAAAAAPKSSGYNRR